jgi:hypothetical protein
MSRSGKLAISLFADAPPDIGGAFQRYRIARAGSGGLSRPSG